ncbi:hypothetical protein KKG58_01280, partial [Patescibacteria group bacterium]|nr:hypothetical protein [Patescibacteria group bacterium]
MNNLNKIKVGEKKHLIYDDRYFRLNAERVMKGNVIRALVELITNCDDSYSRLGKNGSKETIGTIEIRIFRKRNSCTTFKILDRAEGMTLENMYSKIGRVGYANSGFLEGKPSRGLMGRGAKECVIFGSLRYQSIKDDGYAETEINRKHLDLIAIADRPVNEADRVNLEINKGNGTLVTLEVDPKWKIPNNETFIKKFPKYYSLRDIMSEDNRKIIFIDERKPNKKYHLIYDYPDGKTVFNEEISIPEYPNANPMLIIKRSKERIKTEASSDYWEGGFQVKSEKAIHEVTSFSKDIENDLPYFEYYFGFLVCNYIDKLVRDYEKIEKKKGDHTDRNPFYIIDPERNGLNVEHPFTRALYKEAGIVVKNLLKKEREKENNKIREIENRETKNRLKKLAKEVSKFIKENVEDIEIPVDEYYIDSSEIPSGGWRIIPKGLNIPIGQEKRVYIYCKPISCKEKEYIEISTLNKDNI